MVQKVEGDKMNLKSSRTLMAIIMVSVCGWAAVVGLVIKPIFWIGAVLSVAGGIAIGGVVAYLMRRWWLKGIERAMGCEETIGSERV